jgi:hypothetical protein
VTDRTGAFVKDLTRDDFEIFEDGKLQKPAAFSLVDLPIERPFTPADGGEAEVDESHTHVQWPDYVLLLTTCIPT